MSHVTGTIEGLVPILFNKPYTEPSSKQSEERRKATASRERIYRNGAGVFLPAWSFKKMLCDGITMAGLKVGQKSLIPYLQASLFMDEDPLFGVEDADFLHEVWGRVPPKRGAMVKVWRPALDKGWHLRFGLTLQNDLVRPEQVQKALETAGLLVGLGAWRPEYGRFVIRDWNIT